VKQTKSAKAGETLDVLRGRYLPQFRRRDGETTVIATSPSGDRHRQDAARPDSEAAHAFMRLELFERFGAEGKNIRLLYGGSANPRNAGEIIAIAARQRASGRRRSLKAADSSPSTGIRATSRLKAMLTPFRSLKGLGIGESLM